MHPSISAASETPRWEGKEAQSWLCSSGLPNPLQHHSSSNLCRTPTPTQLRESNNSGNFTSKFKKLISSLAPQQSRKSTRIEGCPLSGCWIQKFRLILEKIRDEHGGWHWTTPQPTKGTSSAAQTPPKPPGSGGLFVLACFLIFRSVWENYVRDPPTERIPNVSPDGKLALAK